jgi:hypothetical protein
LGGPIVLIWDNLNTHTSAATRELVAARDCLHVIRLPAYARTPEAGTSPMPVCGYGP